MAADPFAAQILRASLDGFAGIATSRIFESDPSFSGRHGPNAFQSWRAHMSTELDQLAAAVADGVPDRFATRVAWSRSAFQARGVPVGDLALGLQSLRAALQEGLPPAVWSTLEEYLDLAVSRLRADDKLADSQLDGKTANGKLTLDYIAHILAGDPLLARDRIKTAVADGLDVREALLKVLVPAMQEVGRMWHLNEISIAEEHLATRVTRRLMSRLVEDAPAASSNGKTVVVAAASGDAHEIAVELVSDLFHLDGWNAVGLGPNVPGVDIALAAERFHADLVAISATLDVQREAVADAVRALRTVPRKIPVLVGGNAFNGDEDLWKTVGADGYAPDASQATRRGAELLN